MWPAPSTLNARCGRCPSRSATEALAKAADIFTNCGARRPGLRRLCRARQPGLGAADRCDPRGKSRRGRRDSRRHRCGASGPTERARRSTGASERLRKGGSVWTRRGEVFAVHASGNAPGRSRRVAAGAGAGLPRRDPPVEARAVHRTPAHSCVAGSGFSPRRRGVSAHRLCRRRRDRQRRRPFHGLWRAGRRWTSTPTTRRCWRTGRAAQKS